MATVDRVSTIAPTGTELTVRVERISRAAAEVLRKVLLSAFVLHRRTQILQRKAQRHDEQWPEHGRRNGGSAQAKDRS